MYNILIIFITALLILIFLKLYFIIYSLKFWLNFDKFELGI